MYAKQQAAQEVLTALKKAVGKGFLATQDILAEPPKSEMGDLAFPCFQLAKEHDRNPAELATEIAAKIGPTDLIEKIEADGPYVNFTFNDAAYGERVLTEIKKHKSGYGTSKTGHGKTVLVDYAQPNTHKEFHIGHVRNAVLGQAIINVLKVNGYKTIAASYIGDVGAHVAKALWAIKKFHKETDFEPETRAKKLGEIYTEATQYVEKHPKAKDEIDQVQQQLEAGEDPWYGLWKETREWSLKKFREIFKELGVKPDVWYFESEVEKPGKELVKKLLTDGVAKKSEGATIIDLDEEDLGAFLILKSDGSSLYATKDLALAFQKEKEYQADRQIFVVDVRQSLYFKQLFSALKRIGFSKKLLHIAYDMVTLPEGAMSSRAGNIISFEELRDLMVERLEKETRERHEDWSDKKVEETAHQIALAGMIFLMLKQDPKTIITFDLDEALAFDGFSGPYILYTIARIESIRRKTKVRPKANMKYLSGESETALLRLLGDYPELIQGVASDYDIHAIAQWVFETAKTFAEYYHDTKIIDEEDKAATAARLALVYAIEETLRAALRILGVPVVEEM